VATTTAGPPTGAVPADIEQTMAAAQRVLGDIGAAMTCVMCALGDRLGLFRALAAGPATSAEVAERAGVAERYTREWLNALTAAGYVEHEATGGHYSLPAELAPLLAFEGQPLFLGGGFQQLPGLVRSFDEVARAFREGGGISHEAYHDDLWEGMERMSAAWFDTLLVQQWLPQLPDVERKLQEGADVADVGCGNGRALVALALAYPNSRFSGFDASERAVVTARARAEAAGVAGRVRFTRLDVVHGLPGRYDVVTTFDVLHDIAQPDRVLETFRRALRPNGVYLLLEINAHETPEENAGPIGAMLYATSVLFCLPTSLADGAPGYGTLGLPASRVRELCAEAGFSHVREVPIRNPINALYEIRP
jgi:2-polyprenyl-3-methyl-5-hydroxy-6-metoxy-1,4-benzoquinol methylase